MRSKVDFYQALFEQLARRGYEVRRSDSSDYLADIYRKGQLVAFYTKDDHVKQNPFVEVRDKYITQINNIAQATAMRAGICTESPFTDKDEKLPDGSSKLAEYNGVTLACKEHHLFGFVFSTFRTAPDSGETMQRQVFYNKEFAGQDFAKRSGLVDEKALFTETELRVLHSQLVQLNVLDNNVSNDDRIAVGRIIDKIEDIVPELAEHDTGFNFMDAFFRQHDEDMEIGG